MTGHFCNPTTAIAASVVLLVTAGTARGQHRPELGDATLEDLMRVTITTASRTAEGLTGAPAIVEVITAKEIRDRGYRSLADVLRDRAKFEVDLGGDQDLPTQVGVQGVRGAQRIIVLLDGIRISSPTREPLPILSNYPVHAARQIEILYGPASAVYGADAFSAVINIVSKDLSDADALSVSSSIGQYGLQNHMVSSVLRVGRHGSLLVAGQFLGDAQPDMSRFYPDDFQGMRAQRTGVFNTIFGPVQPSAPVPAEYGAAIRSHSLQATFRRKGLQVTFFNNRSRVPTSPAYTPDNAIYSDDAYSDNRLMVGAVTHTAMRRNLTFASSVTVSQHELHPLSGYRNVYSNMKRSYKYAYGAMAKGEEIVSWRPSARTTLMGGGTLERFYSIPQGADLNAPVQSRSQSGTILDTNIVDEFVKLHYFNAGGFVQLQHSLTDAMTITAGTRADYNSRYGATFNPRLGLVAQPRTGTTLKLLYGTAFLAPSPYQEYGHYGAFYSLDGGATFASDYWHVPNPHLKPEHEKTIQGSATQTLGSTVSLSASIFRSELTSLIKESDADRSYSGTYHGWPVAYIDFTANEGHQMSYGGSVDLQVVKRWGLDRRLNAQIGLALADGRSFDEDDAGADHLPVGGIAPVHAGLGADLDWGRWSASARVDSLGRQRVLATTIDERGATIRRTLDGYTVTNVNLRRRNLVKDVDVFLTVENLFDVRYRHINLRAFTNPEELIGAPQNPRRITVGFTLNVR